MYMNKHKQICYLDMTDLLSLDNKSVISIKNLLSRDNKICYLEITNCYLEITNLLSPDNELLSRNINLLSRGNKFFISFEITNLLSRDNKFVILR